MPSIKLPPVIDISHWIDVPDFNALEPKPWLIITKATQGTWLLDAKYGEYAEEIPAAGIRLGAYHFMAPGDEIAQADWFCEIILQVGLHGNEVLGCDMEVPGVSLAEIKNFLDRVQLRTGIRPIIYSSQLMLENLYPNKICPEWLKSETLWIAEYPDSPDLTNEIPLWIVPRGLSKSNIGLWQYTDDGVMKGIPGNNIDLNLINPTYAAAIGLTAPGEPTSEPPKGGSMRGTVKAVVTRSLNVRSTITGLVVAALKYDFNLNKGDVVYGEVRQDDRIYFNKIYRANGSIQTLNEECSAITKEGTSIYMALDEVAEPGTEPLPPLPDPVKSSFTFKVYGFKEYTGELEKE